MIKNIIIAAILVFCLIGTSFAEEEVKKKVVVKELQGEVSGISSNFIAIVYGQDKKTSYEMAFTMDKDVKVEDRKSLKDIGVRDIVSVSFEETTETKKQDDKDISRVVSRVVKKIRFIRPGAKIAEIELRSLEEPGQAEETPEETEEPAEEKE